MEFGLKTFDFSLKLPNMKLNYHFKTSISKSQNYVAKYHFLSLYKYFIDSAYLAGSKVVSDFLEIWLSSLIKP